MLAAAAHALLALLAGDENETVFESAEALWSGPNEPVSLFTGPCDRSSGVLTAGELNPYRDTCCLRFRFVLPNAQKRWEGQLASPLWYPQ